MIANSRHDPLDAPAASRPLSSAAIAAARARAAQLGSADDSAAAVDSGVTSTIPANPRGNLYNMAQVFKVWFDNRDKIMAATLPESARTESYKLAAPEPILHLELDAAAAASIPADDLAALSMSQLEHSLLALSADVPQGGIDSNQGPGTGVNDLSASSSHHAPLVPPGLEPAANGPPYGAPPLLLSPADIKWLYIDPSGNEQGPFDGNMMQDWLTGGYLNMELQIRRQEQTAYAPLRAFCESVRNFAQPFLVPLEPVANDPAPPANLHPHDSHYAHQHQHQHQQQQQQQQQQQHQQQQHSQFHPFIGGGLGQLGSLRLNTLLSLQSNLFGNDFISSPDPFATPNPANAAFASSHDSPQSFGMENNLPFANPMSAMPSLYQLIHHHQRSVVALPALSRTNSSWLLDGGSALLQLKSPQPLAATLQPAAAAPLSPWIASSGLPPRVSSPFVHQALDPSLDLDLLDGPAKNPRDTSPSPSAPLAVAGAVAGENRDPRQPAATPRHADPALSNDGGRAPPLPVASNQKQDKPAAAAAAAAASAPSSSPQTQSRTPHPRQLAEVALPKPTAVAENSQKPQETLPARIVNLKPAVAPEQKLAPWAAKAPATAKPALTLKEIQALEAERMERARQEQLLLRMEQLQIEQQIQQQQLLAAAKQAPPAAGLPKTSSWAVPKPSAAATPTAGQKTLAQIQREEAEAAAARAKAAKANSNATAGPGISSFASAVANSGARDDNSNAWTTVSQKKVPAKKAAVTPISAVSSASAKLDPAVLRSVSAARPAPASNPSQLLRQDCLVWARAAMTNLYPAVSKDDLLDIFVSMPASLPDTMAVIAETIYALSATMDGRRFALEFLKRKQKVDQQCGSVSDAAWLLAVASSANKSVVVDDDGWSTLSKKKGKKPF